MIIPLEDIHHAIEDVPPCRLCGGGSAVWIDDTGQDWDVVAIHVGACPALTPPAEPRIGDTGNPPEAS